MITELFDTHCHLTVKDLLSRRERAIAEAVEAGVSRMITVACSPDEFETALATRQMHDRIWIAAGFHPHEAGRIGDDDLKRLTAFLQEPGVAAAGEMGLDYHYDFSPRDVQQTVFRRQLDLAAEADLPVIIHCREAHDDVVRILTEHGFADKSVVFHCFSGDAEQAAELRADGWWTSFTGILTFKNARETQRVCVETPDDQLLFETDAPYLSPEPVRKMRPNEPKNLVHTARFAAQLRGESFDTLAEISTANAMRFFRLDAL